MPPCFLSYRPVNTSEKYELSHLNDDRRYLFNKCGAFRVIHRIDIFDDGTELFILVRRDQNSIRLVVFQYENLAVFVGFLTTGLVTFDHIGVGNDGVC